MSSKKEIKKEIQKKSHESVLVVWLVVLTALTLTLLYCWGDCSRRLHNSEMTLKAVSMDRLQAESQNTIRGIVGLGNRTQYIERYLDAYTKGNFGDARQSTGLGDVD